VAGNQIAVASPITGAAAIRVLVQKQLRGVGRFGYSVSKENFRFSKLDNPFMPNTGRHPVFHCAGRVLACAYAG